MHRNIYNLINSKHKKNYQYDPVNAETIGAVILQANETMLNPVAAHFVLFTKYDFKISSIVARLKRVLGNEVNGLMYFWSVEQTYMQKFCETVHIHFCLILDVPFLNADYDHLFKDIALPALQGLKHVDVNYNDSERAIVKRMRYLPEEGIPNAA